MKFNKETVGKIAANAKAAQETWGSFVHNKKMCECFHLRPTASGITVISTLPYAPMRGIPLNAVNLKSMLDEISANINVLLGVDDEKSLKLLDKWGFKRRKPGSFLEENAQAFFIQGMILKQKIYEGIEFVASELVLAGSSNRFDIVGYKDGTLYIFEMKKDRETAGLIQTAGYAKLANENKSHYLEVLKNYPHCPVADFNEVIPVAVMKYAANAVTQLENKAKEAGVGLWFYERSIALRKANV
jgi:hypothetical protein